jgi:hypothetical protein
VNDRIADELVVATLSFLMGFGVALLVLTWMGAPR